MSKPYNTTQLNPETCFEKHVFHRDQFAHYLRWSHVLKRAKIGMKILDVGCGSGNLAEVFYRNRYKPEKYLGIEIRQKTVDECSKRFKNQAWAQFLCSDLIQNDIRDIGNDWDIVCSFEVLEHVGTQNVPILLDKIKNVMNKETIFLMSTPCYDSKVGAADNHTYDSGDGRGIAVHEWTYSDMKKLLEEKFDVVDKWGTFASIKDYKEHIPSGLYGWYSKAHEYFDSNVLSNLMAPFFPEYSRNVLWECKLKGEQHENDG